MTVNVDVTLVEVTMVDVGAGMIKVEVNVIRSSHCMVVVEAGPSTSVVVDVTTSVAVVVSVVVG